ncbi:MAG: ribonucleoside-triphosphate reductase, partial [Patescibacteria group bacterium]
RRPQGARLKIMGGKSSGPEPLRAVLEFSRRKVLANQGRRLRPIHVHDIICKIGEVVVMGGVRRTALISVSDLDDDDMRFAKTGQFYLSEPQRAMANNSAVYTEKPGASVFLDEWIALAKSGSGERGIFNRGGLKAQLPERRWKAMKKHAKTTGTNPCGEIILRSKEFCNLTEVVARADDTEETLLRKVRVAALLGTYQSTFTDFPVLSSEWKKNCEEERLLGVSITGQWDCAAVRNPGTLRRLREAAVKANEEYAACFGVNPSLAVTCVKPSGTVSQLVDASSGLHPRHAPYYIR